MMFGPVISATRYEDGWLRIDINDNYIEANADNKELKRLLAEFYEVVFEGKKIKGQLTKPEYAELIASDDGYCRVVKYPAVIDEDDEED